MDKKDIYLVMLAQDRCAIPPEMVKVIMDIVSREYNIIPNYCLWAIRMQTKRLVIKSLFL